MIHHWKIISIIVLGLFATPTILAGQFVVELDQPLSQNPDEPMKADNVALEHSFSAGVDSYAVFSADDEESLTAFLQKREVYAEKISEVLFVNSPTLSGGPAAGLTPKDGHQVFVIERPIPGVGFLGYDKKKVISKKSNAAITTLGDIIEWDQSYLTSEGTYCVYRAVSSETLYKHGALAGAPVGKITPVDHKVH